LVATVDVMMLDVEISVAHWFDVI